MVLSSSDMNVADLEAELGDYYVQSETLEQLKDV